MAFHPLFVTLFAIASLLMPPSAFAQQASGPIAGTRIADFSLQDQDGEIQKLSELLSEGPIALVVVRSAGWCTLSKNQLRQLQNELESIEATGIRLVGLSYDRAETLNDFADSSGIQIPLLADPESRVIQQLGIVNTARKIGTIRYKVAHPMTILISSDRTVAGVVQGNDAMERHDSKQLIDAWTKVKPAGAEQNKISFIKVRGNQFIDESGTQIVFKGLAISDPDKIVGDGRWSKKHFEVIKSWGVNVVRIPVHPSRLRKRGLENYLRLLDEAVKWCGELKMYVIIDWHSIGNLRMEKFESDVYSTSLQETLAFWEATSKRFKGNPTVAFYEIFNELAVHKRKPGVCTWPQWKAIVERIIDVISAEDKNVITLVGGFDWSYDLRDVKDNPIQRPNIGYVVHPYPGKCKPPREPHWEEHFGFLASRHPIFATEMGYSIEGEFKNMNDDGTFRNAILKYLDSKKISWCVWVFDPDWSPALIKSYAYDPSHPGAFFRDAMRAK